MAASVGPAAAQGFFESVFGFASPPKQSSPPPYRAPPPAVDHRYREPSSPPPRAIDREERSGYDSGNYRTVCVRLCDGYYFPISGAVSRRAFHRDAQICRRSCGTDAVLFYHPTSTGDANEMVDLSGRAYPRLPNAFLYRKQLVSGCKCRPEPWTQSEMTRHGRYAAEANSPAADAPSPPPTPDPTAGDTVAGDPGTDSSTPPEPSKPKAAAPIAEQRQAEKTVPPHPGVPRQASRRDPAQPSSFVSNGASVQPRPRPAAATPGFFSLGLGGSNQPKLRWPGD